MNGRRSNRHDFDFGEHSSVAERHALVIVGQLLHYVHVLDRIFDLKEVPELHSTVVDLLLDDLFLEPSEVQRDRRRV